MFQAYRFCKVFNCSLEDYERRPFKETAWMLAIDAVYNQATNEVNEKAQRGY